MVGKRKKKTATPVKKTAKKIKIEAPPSRDETPSGILILNNEKKLKEGVGYKVYFNPPFPQIIESKTFEDY